MKHHYKNLRIQWGKQFYLCLVSLTRSMFARLCQITDPWCLCRHAKISWQDGLEEGKDRKNRRVISHQGQTATACTILPPTLFFPLFAHHLACLIITLASRRRLEGGGSPCIAFTTLRTLDKTSLFMLPHASMLIIVEMLNFQR